jgi:putative nucleotidyltransferase with HDIG domain
MPAANSVLLISDRPDRSRELAGRLARLSTCRTIPLYGDEGPTESVSAVVTDVDFDCPADIDRLRQLLSKPRAAAAPILAILRDSGYPKQIQAAAIGATWLFPASAPFSEIRAALSRVLRRTMSELKSHAGLPSSPNIEQARLDFANIFRAAAVGQTISRPSVDGTTTSVMAAVNDGGIRQWLDVVWTYDDATYQHCMLVTGLAAEFASRLRFAENDQKHLVRGALLHDVGKAKIPVSVLNKAGPLTSDEIAVMHTHPGIGYELLRQQGDFESDLLEVVHRHHELLDGSGYPDGLAGSQISDLVRLVTICDIYAALIERRPYKQPMQPAQAFKMLEDMDGKLEGALVRTFGQVAELSAARP